MDALRQRIERAIEAKVFPGCVIGLIRANKRIVIPVGTIDGTVRVQENTIYDLASITKSIPVASLALMLMEEYPLKLNLRGSVKEYLPELQDDYGATIEDLLRYRVTGPRMSDLKLKTFEEIRTHILERGFNGPPGESTYTNLPAFILGLVIERVTGKIFPALAEEHFFEPLQMHDTSFFPKNPTPSTLSDRPKLMVVGRIAPTEVVDGEEIRGIVHDESARVFAREHRAVGHAGLFSTVPDLLNFLEALLDVGFTKSHMRAVLKGAQKGLGWEACPNREGRVERKWMGTQIPRTVLGNAARFGKTGFTGTSILCDIEKGIGLVILSNRTYPHRPPDNSAINLFRKDIADIVLQ